MVSCVGPTDCWWINSRLAFHCERVRTDSSRRVYHEPGEGLEVEPELADVVRHLVDGEGAGGGAAGFVPAGVGGVPDVGRVGGDDGAAGRGVDHTADAETRGTVPVRAPALG